MNPRPDPDELAQLAEFQRRHRVSLLCLVCVELAGLARLRRQLGDAGAVRVVRLYEQVIRDLLAGFPGGLEVRSGNGSAFLVFEKPSDAVRFSLALQGKSRLLGQKQGHTLEERVGIHVGEVLVEIPEGSERVQGLNGLHVDICEALRSLAVPGQILLTQFAYESARQSLRAQTGAGVDAEDFIWADHGAYRVEGSDDPIEVCEVADRRRGLPEPPKGNDRIRPVGVTLGRGEFADPDARAQTGFWRRFRSPDATERGAARNGAILAALLGMVFLFGGWLDGLSYDLPYRLRPSGQPEGVVIVEMDERSHLQLNQELSKRWNRSLHAQLLDRLRAAGAKAVGFDVLFDNQTNPAADQEFHQSLQRFGAAVLGTKTITGPLGAPQIAPPDELFRSVARWGPVESPADSLVIRRPISGSLGRPSMSRLLAETALGHPVDVPADAWMNYYGPPGTIPARSFVSVLSNEVPAAVFSNKVVYVGANAVTGFSGDIGADYYRSPYSRWRLAHIPGVEVNATSYANLIHNDWLRRLSPWLEFLAVLAVGAASGWTLVFFHPVRSVALGLGTALGLALLLAAQVWVTHRWFPWLVVCGIQLPAATVWAIVFRTRLTAQENRKVKEFLAAKKNVVAPEDSGGGAPSGGINPGPAQTRTMSGGTGGGTRKVSVPAQAPVSRAAEDAATSLALPAEELPTQKDPLPRPATAGHRHLPPIPDHELVRQVGAGAYGEVWLAKDILGTHHAVKIIRPDDFGDNTRLDREFNGLQKYTPISRSHPGLVHILHVGRHATDGFIYYVMEAGDDATTGTRIVPDTYVARNLATDIEKQGRIPLARVVAHGIALADALGFLHRSGLIHRDIKPANIIFVHGRPKLADIGLVTEIASPGREISFIGTQGYMPPEGPGAPSADVFSLGRLLYVAATGNPVRHFPDMPGTLMDGPELEAAEEFARILRKACEPIEAKRYQKAEELLEDLRALEERMNRTKVL